ncbi:MAG: phosphomannomutase CpsG [Shewanella sp.]|nr:phosphomannomutase CpsG [Shewanella sp.]
MADKLTCFKAYDIRGQLGTQLNAEIAYRIGRAFAIHTGAKTVVVGGDARETSEPLKMALAEGLMAEGCNVQDIGLVGTEEIYFATSHLKMDGGIMVTASHNPIDYNGMKLVREQSKPISGDTGLFAIQEIAQQQPWLNEAYQAAVGGTLAKVDSSAAYIDHLMNYINPENIKPLKLVVNSGNGAAGHVVDKLEARFAELGVPVNFIKVHHQPDPTFPNGIPNPLLPENRAATAEAVRLHKADMGIAWDGDFDRCFLFDENGDFVEGYYIVGLLAEAFLKKAPGEKIIYDPRVYWNTEDIIEKNNGIAVMSKTGHAFIKEKMREENAIYGGEMSAHHYFRDFNYCDSGMIPWLLVAELVCVKNTPLSQLVNARIDQFPSSGEINFTVASPQETIDKIKGNVWSELLEIREIDGIDMIFRDWRFNLRMSNTEPVIRLNLEASSISLMQEKLAFIQQFVV